MTETQNRSENSVVVGGTNIVGDPINRVDGRLKVTGTARYAAEHPIPNLAHAVAVTSTISNGKITGIDVAAAKAVPGVILIMTPDDMDPVEELSRNEKLGGQFGQTRAGLQGKRILFGGQYVAVVVADSLTQARQAASLIKVNYAAQTPEVNRAKALQAIEKPKEQNPTEAKPDYSRGDADKIFESAEIKIQQTYTTAPETHNPMEMHATIAVWEGDRLTLYDATQHVLGVKDVIAHRLEMPRENIRVISPFLGGGFGSKGSTWPHVTLAAVAARRANRPVKLMLTRPQMFTQVGYRPITVQKMTLGADKTGKLQSISHDIYNQTSIFDQWVEQCSKPTKFLYSCDNVKIGQRLFRFNTGTPCQMRAPGDCPGSFALEVAMDELAYATNVDPLQLRLVNYSEKDEAENMPYSSKALKKCYQLGAERFGWSKRKMAPRSVKDGRYLIGHGMATATYPANFAQCTASAKLFPDGRAVVSAATHDLGTGQYTIMTQVAAAYLGIPVEKVKFQLGDTLFPKAPVAGGSQSAASVGSAVLAAAQALVTKIGEQTVADEKSPLHGKDAKMVVINNDRIELQDGSTGETVSAFFARNGNRPIEATGDATLSDEMKKYSKHSFGAHFAEVRVDEQLGEIRVTRYVGAFAGGKILNEKTARSQMIGGIVMGIGMALHEETTYDPISGRVINDNLADYLVPVNADIPHIDAFFVEEKDEHVNPIGAKGLGELGIVGAAAAIANAVFHATGKRVRDLPIRIDQFFIA